MKIFGFELRSLKKENNCCNTSASLPYKKNISSYSNALSLSTVYRCVEAISNSIAQLPFVLYKKDSKGYLSEYKDSNIYDIIQRFPNENMTSFTFLKCIISDCILSGNGYAYIMRSHNGVIESIYYIPSNIVTVEYDQINIINRNVRYRVIGFNRMLESWEMIHLINYSKNGIVGMSTLAYARVTLGLGLASNSHAKKIFETGANMSGIVKVESSLTPNQKSDIKDSWNQTFNQSDSGGIAVLEGNMTFQPVQISPVDSQMLEQMKFNVVEICRFFGVNPISVFDYTHNSYSTVEATQLAFLTDTLSPIMRKIELEFERKLFSKKERSGIDLKFDTKQLVRADLNTRGNYYKSLFNLGAITPNEIRREMDMNPYDSSIGDKAYMQVNMTTIEKINNNES